MFTMNDLKQTRVYQDARQEGRQEGEMFLVLRIFNRHFGNLSDRLTNSIQDLEITQIEELADQLLDFKSVTDLENWLESQSSLKK